jgi:hypothetical protein
MKDEPQSRSNQTQLCGFALEIMQKDRMRRGGPAHSMEAGRGSYTENVGKFKISPGGHHV